MIRPPRTEPADHHDVMAALRVAVFIHGQDKVDPNYPGSCVYFTASGAPSCIVGHVIDLVGFQERPSRIAHSVPERIDPTDELHEYWGRNFTPWARRIMHAAQEVQDNGKTWGEARDAAAVLYELFKEADAYARSQEL